MTIRNLCVVSIKWICEEWKKKGFHKILAHVYLLLQIIMSSFPHCLFSLLKHCAKHIEHKRERIELVEMIPRCTANKPKKNTATFQWIDLDCSCCVKSPTEARYTLKVDRRREKKNNTEQHSTHSIIIFLGWFCFLSSSKHKHSFFLHYIFGFFGIFFIFFHHICVSYRMDEKNKCISVLRCCVCSSRGGKVCVLARKSPFPTSFAQCTMKWIYLWKKKTFRYEI